MVKQNKPVVIWCLPSLLAQLTLQWNPALVSFLPIPLWHDPLLSWVSNQTIRLLAMVDFLSLTKFEYCFLWWFAQSASWSLCPLKNNLQHLHWCSINPQALPLSNSNEEMHNAQPKPSYCSSPALSILFPPPTSPSARETLHRLLSYRL